MSDYFDPVYKGSTSPATMLGIPLMPFILATLCFAQCGIVAFMVLKLAGLAAVATIYAALFRWARRVTRSDEQRLLQMILRVKSRWGQRTLRAYWGAASYSPLNTTRR